MSFGFWGNGIPVYQCRFRDIISCSKLKSNSNGYVMILYLPNIEGWYLRMFDLKEIASVNFCHILFRCHLRAALS